MVAIPAWRAAGERVPTAYLDEFRAWFGGEWAKMERDQARLVRA